jgi:uncharacterized membrane protein YqgA involved in biofilm formation
MFVGFGTLLNIVGIAGGSALGVLFGNRIPEKTRRLITDALGCVTMLAAVDALREIWNPSFISSLPKGWTILTVLASLLLGALVGSILQIEERLERFGVQLRSRFSRGEKGSFLDGFMAASLLFAIGPLAILGSISDGMGNGHQQLILKSTLDCITSIAFGATFGWGVAFSFIPVGIYQGIWTVAGLGLGNVMNAYQVGAMTAVGGVLLVGISLRVLEIKFISVGDLLPAIFFAPVIATAAHYWF